MRDVGPPPPTEHEVVRGLARPGPVRPAAWRRVLLTAPHACETEPPCARPLDDPHSRALARAVARALRARGIHATCLCATVPRRVHDQNRLKGLYAAGDLLPRLVRLPPLGDTLHLDVHTFTRERRPPEWGAGVNLIPVHGAAEQAWLAAALARPLRGRVVPMRRLPRHPADAESNGVIEWTRHRGATSVLMEAPVTYDARDPTLFRPCLPGLAEAVAEAVAPLCVTR